MYSNVSYILEAMARNTFPLRNTSAYTLNYPRIVILVNTATPLKSVQVLLGTTWVLKQKAPMCVVAVW